MSIWWERYLEERFRAQKNLCQILRYRGLQSVEKSFDPDNIQEFRHYWEEFTNPSDRTGILKRDARPQHFQAQDGHTITILFATADVRKVKIPKATVRSYLLEFIKITTQLTGEQAFNQIELIPDRECILISYVPLDGAARNEIAEFNAILQYPIQHFTIAELSFDPTIHRAGPKSMTVLTPAEVETLIAEQRGLLLNGKDHLVPNYEETLARLKDDAERYSYIQETNEKILSTIPTTNTNDPWVKWRGFKVGDILRVERRVGNTKNSYRRVILVEAAENKPPKVKAATTTK
jgi:DNA-directed RNA polymerase subunit H (RpoH/RPB5)